MSATRPLPRVTTFPGALLAMSALAITIASLVSFQIQQQRLKDRVKTELEYVADVKVRAITDQIRTRRNNAYVLSRNQIFTDTVVRWLEAGAPVDATGDKIQLYLAELITAHQYDGVVLFDGNMDSKLVVGPHVAVDADDRKNAMEAFRSGRIIVSDFEVRQDASEPFIPFDLYVPLLAAGKTGLSAAALVMLRINATKFIDPKILSWHEPSASAEAILVRREDDKVVYLTALRHQQDAPLMLKLPVSKSNLPAALAISGHEGEVDGVDYRGVPVVAALRKIPDFPWYLVAKIDAAEAHAPIRELALLIAAMAALAFFGVSGTALFWWRAQRSQVMARDAQAQAEHLALIKHFDYLAKYANDAITLADERGNFIEVNDRAVAESGYSHDQFLQMNQRDVYVPEALPCFERIAAGAGAAGQVFETVARCKDGSTYPVEVSARAIEIDGRRFNQSIVRNITERKRSRQALLNLNRALRALSSCNEALIHATDEAHLLQEICRIVVEIAGYRLAWVGFAEHDVEKKVRPVAHAGYDDGFIERANISWADNKLGGGPAGMAIRTQKACVVQDAHTDSTYEPWRTNAITIGYGSVASFPLVSSGNVLGALCIYSSTINGFAEDEIRLLTEFADDLAFGIITLRTRALEARSGERLRRTMEGTILAMGSIVEMRDPYTAGHQRRVSALSAAMAREMGLTEAETHGISLAAAIHDLGKIKVPAEILVKPGKLTDIEFSLIKAHSQAGYDILKEIDFPWPVAQIVYQHHERLDGSGYPLALKEPVLLIGAKIIAVADTVEAMSSHRPYRSALGIDKALEEIVRNRGVLYDAQAVDSCVQLFKAGRFTFPQ